MPNNLTGAYEAVFLVRVRQINGILGTLHHNRVNPAASPSFPHSVPMRLGAPAVADVQDAVRFRNWTLEAASAAGGAASPEAMREMIAGDGPPAVAAFFDRAWTTLDPPPVVAGAGGARGSVEVQVSSPTITIPPGTGSQVTVHAHVRARFISAVSSPPIPEFIHGRVTAAYTVERLSLPGGKIVLRAQASGDDSQIHFAAEPGSGASAADVLHISSEVRIAVRDTFKALDIDLPPDFAFTEFKVIGSGDDEAIVLPFQISGGLPRAGELDSVVTSFLGPAEFAIAITKERVEKFLDDMIELIQALVASMDVTLSGPLGTARYTPTISPVSMGWKSGQIEFSAKVDLSTDTWWAPNGFITFTQAVALVLNPATRHVSVQPAGDPVVDEPWWMPHDTAVNEVKKARDGALPAAQSSLHAGLEGARSRLLAGLQSFDSFATVAYTGIEITPDGVILRGSIGTGGRVTPIAAIDEIDGGTALSAFRSWIPGGRIKTFRWTWVEYVHPIPWFNKTQSVESVHHFVQAKSPSMAKAGSVCLQVIGSRISSDGFLDEPVSGGDVCRVSSHEPILVVPPWAFEAVVPIWRVDPPFDANLSEAVVGHVNIAGGRRPGALGPNVLVLFSGEAIDEPLPMLARALDGVQQREHSLMVFVVLPRGAFEVRRADLDARLGEVPRDLAATLSVTEDYNGGWSRIFGARPGVPAAHLLSPRGASVWSHEGAFGDALGSALRRHLEPAPPPAGRTVALRVNPGQAAPDDFLRDIDGQELSVRRMRGRDLQLVFWQSWSAPSIRELQRLEALRRGGADTSLIGISSGESRATVEQARRRHGLTMPIVADTDSAVATRYGVSCWPTTVSIAKGVVGHIQFGLAHEHRADAITADRESV